jgi:hypothetical protein
MEVFLHLLLLRYPKVLKRRNPCPLHAILKDEMLKDKTIVVRSFLKFFGVHAKDEDTEGVSLTIASSRSRRGRA